MSNILPVLVIEAAIVINHHFDERETLLGFLVHAKNDDFLNSWIDFHGGLDVFVKQADGKNVLGSRVFQLTRNLL